MINNYFYGIALITLAVISILNILLTLSIRKNNKKVKNNTDKIINNILK